MRVALIESLFGSLGLSTVDSDGYRMTKYHKIIEFVISDFMPFCIGL